MHIACKAMLAGLFLAASAAGQPFFLSLGDLPTGELESIPEAISADGTTVVGSASVTLEGSAEPTMQAFRWTRAEGMVPLGTLPGFTGESVAAGVSTDGGIIAGTAKESNLSGSRSRAFVWTRARGIEELGLLAGTSGSRAEAVSADGTIIAGRCDSFAVRWVNGAVERATGLTGSIHAISADGTTIVGAVDGEAYRWREETGMERLGILPGGRVYGSLAECVSADGSVVVGYSDSARSPEGCCVFEIFRWTEEEGMQGLSFMGRPYALSADGGIIGGSFHSLNPAGAAFLHNRWTRYFRSVLASYRAGEEIYDWRFWSIADMTPDGRTYTGVATDADGKQLAFIASIGEFCLVDWDRSGTINSQDFFDFIAMFFAGQADYDGNGETNYLDYLGFSIDLMYRECD